MRHDISPAFSSPGGSLELGHDERVRLPRQESAQQLEATPGRSGLPHRPVRRDAVAEAAARGGSPVPARRRLRTSRNGLE